MLRRLLLVVVLVGLLLTGAVATSAQDTDHILIPIGGGYGPTFEGFLDAALTYAQTLDTDRLYVLMLPMSFTYDPEVLTAEDLLDNSLAIERRRRQMEDACKLLMEERGLAYYCQIEAPPIYNREAAEAEYALEYFADDLAAVYFPGGDQTFAMIILNGSPLEAALEDAFARGVVMGGNSAGAAMTSRNMIGGYTSEDLGVVDQLRDNAVDLWTTDDRRGLPFGLESVIVEQHFIEYGRPGRLLNVLVQPGIPPVGIGVDGYTGAVVVNDELLSHVIGAYGVGVIDVATLDAVSTANFDRDGLLSVRNALFHMLAPGEFSYDIPTRTTSIAPTLDEVTRDYSGLALPEAAGTLILGSDLTTVGLEANAVLARFVELAGGAEANIVVISMGYATVEESVSAAEAYAAALAGANVSAQSLQENMIMPQLTQYDGVLVVAGDQSLITAAELQPVADALLGGIPVLADNAAAPVFGRSFAAHRAVDYDNDDSETMEAHDQGSYVAGGTTIVDGLGLVGANFEPQLIDNNRWGRLISLAYNQPNTLALGLTEGSAVEITSEGASALGSNGVIVFDFHAATLELGTNDVLVFANALMDAFAPGEVFE